MLAGHTLGDNIIGRFYLIPIEMPVISSILLALYFVKMIFNVNKNQLRDK